MKNNTVLTPVTTLGRRFRAASSGGANSGANRSGSSTSSGGGTSIGTVGSPDFVPDPRLSTLSIKIANIDRMDEALQQAKNVLMHSHKGIEDFSFRTQENWS